jgi:hypothetical protein
MLCENKFENFVGLALFMLMCIYDPHSKGRNDKQIIDSYVESLGMYPIGDNWVQINRETASKILIDVLHRDLAYGDEIMSIEDATHLMTAFLERFTNNPLYYTNIVLGRSWMPVTGATFDAGVVVSDDILIGLLWAEEQD